MVCNHLNWVDQQKRPMSNSGHTLLHVIFLSLSFTYQHSRSLFSRTPIIFIDLCTRCCQCSNYGILQCYFAPISGSFVRILVSVKGITTIQELSWQLVCNSRLLNLYAK